MATFAADLWTAVLEGGTNRSLVLATHGSFAALQLVLAMLLAATRSWHFVFLSLLCAATWGGIIWFVAELDEIKRVEALEKAREAEAEAAGEGGGNSDGRAEKEEEGDEEVGEEIQEEGKKER